MTEQDQEVLSLFLWIVSLALRNISRQRPGKDWSADLVALVEEKIDVVGADPQHWELSDEQMLSLRQAGEAIRIRHETDDWIASAEKLFYH